MSEIDYCPPPEAEGGWRLGEPGRLGVDASLLKLAAEFHDTHDATRSYGGALIVVYKGHIVSESYVTGEKGGPKPWSRATCNDIKSSTKSVFGTVVGAFMKDHREVSLDTPLVGEDAKRSLIPQMWERPLTDERKTQVLVSHVLSMTSGHDSREPWLAPGRRQRYTGYSSPYQMYEYCFGWWRFNGIPSQHRLLFEPGTNFNYSNFGLELLALAMRNASGVEVGHYAWDNVLREIGMPEELAENFYRVIPYADDNEFNFSDTPGWGVGGGEGCNAYGADGSSSPIGYNTIVGSTFRCSARDFARLGYIWLHKGRWGGRQLVPENWIRLATKRHKRSDGTTPVNYGHTFWIKDNIEGVPADTFGSRGHNINDCYVVPSLDLVVARLGNDNPPREQREEFVNGLLARIIKAVKP